MSTTHLFCQFTGHPELNCCQQRQTLLSCEREGCCGVPQYPLATVGTEHKISHLQISFQPFLICYSLVVLPLNAVQSELLMASLKKPQTN